MVLSPTTERRVLGDINSSAVKDIWNKVSPAKSVTFSATDPCTGDIYEVIHHHTTHTCILFCRTHGDIVFPYQGEAHENGVPHGKGVIVLAETKERYVGQFKNGKFHGAGTIAAPDGTCYTGQWYEEAKHGEVLDDSTFPYILKR